MLGVRTIGNATLIAYEDRPILATDPWLGGEDDAYFGSWNLLHEVPARERQDILSAEYLWFSHGHPDHLNPNSMPRFKGQKILLPDHLGGRIRNGLMEQGFDVTVLPDLTWVPLSPRIRVMCATTAIQDAVLFVDVGGRLFVDLNDSAAAGRERLVRRVVSQYEHSTMLKISGYGDADMANFFTEEGERIPQRRMHHEKGVGYGDSEYAAMLGIRQVIPFSSHHFHQRADSAWANQYTTPVEDYAIGFKHEIAEFVPAYVSIDCTDGSYETIDPKPIPQVIHPPEHFGDSWSDELDAEDRRALTQYFQRKELLHDMYGFIRFKVGGKLHTVSLNGPAEKGVTFETPRASLMAAVGYEIFDDLLIGNYARTTLHGVKTLYEPNFNFVVAKYADNGRAQTREEVQAYLRTYAQRVEQQRLRDGLLKTTREMVRGVLPEDSRLYELAKRAYRALRH